MTAVADLLADGAATLAAAGIESAGFEARVLLARALGVERSALVDRAREVDPGTYADLIARRAAREPLAFILGTCGFWSLELEVSPATLIPRPDTETLIEAALAALPDRRLVRSVLDLGTGTGCLLLAALAEYPRAWGVGIDLSAEAAALARRNATRNGLAHRAAFLAGDWAAPLAARFDLVLSNPPYIDSADVPGLMPEVARHEPLRALDGGPDGLDAYRALVPRLPGLLAPGGVAVLELGAAQALAVAAIACASGFDEPGLRRDLAGIERALVLRAGTC